MSFVLKKSERLSSGIYLLTGLMSDSEPMRGELRKKAVTILSDIGALDGKRFLDRSESLGVVFHEIDAVRSLLMVARTGQLLSEMNTSLVSREFGVLKTALEAWAEVRQPEGGLSLSPEFFLGEMPLSFPRLPTPENPTPARTVFPGGAKPEPTQDSVPLTSFAALPRRDAILSYLKEHPAATLKEIREGTPLGQDLSEKTIQRELVSLVLEGLVVRAGERRWSRYSLA